MPWEDIGGVGHGSILDDREWIGFCLELAKGYVTLVAGKPPEHCEIGIIGHDHELGDYPSLGLCTEELGIDLDIEYVVACQNALAAFDDAVDWTKLKEHWDQTRGISEENEDGAFDTVHVNTDDESLKTTNTTAISREHADLANFRAPVLDAESREIAEIVIRNEDGKYVVERTTFYNSFSRNVSEAEAASLRSAARAQDWATLDEFDPEFLPWYCRQCGTIYSNDQWRVQARFDPEEGWLDSHRGRCPSGHERMSAG